MNRDLLEKAISHISDAHITEAANPKRHRKFWIPTVAAATAAAILVLLLVNSLIPKPTPVISADPLRLAAAPRITAAPIRSNYESKAEFDNAINAWHAEQAARGTLKSTALAQLDRFFIDSSAIFLSGEGNQLWSPANAYVGLAMLAELTAGESQRQILNLLGTDHIDALRKQTAAMFESAYFSDGKEISKLANSLWLREGLSCKEDALDTLAYYYYASVYSGDLASDEIAQSIAAWLNENTGGLLAEYPPQKLSLLTVFALYSTIYFQAQWDDCFYPQYNKQGIFHSPSGNRNVTYMNKTYTTDYYWGNSFGAVSLSLNNGSRMWFILPDEGKTTADLLSEGQYMDVILSNSWENRQTSRVNLSVPKFDVSGKQSLVEGLKQLGVTDIFSIEKADFSNLADDTQVYVDFINQAVRVQIDEEGVTGAAYIEIGGVESAPPPGEEVDFSLDRPFLFIITSDNVPLFSGVVNEP